MSHNTLTKRSDGRYKVNYGTKQFYGKSKSEAERKREAWIDDEKAGLNHDTDNMTFLDYALTWIEVYRTECCEKQRLEYIRMMKFAATKLKVQLMRAITVTDLQSVCNSLSCYSPTYVGKFMTTLRGIFRTALAEGVILRNPMEIVKPPKTKKVEGHRALEPWERSLVCSTYNEHPFGLCAMVMMFAGLRRGEALYLDIDRDVDFIRKTITVRGAVSFSDGNQAAESPGKTEAAQRVIPLFEPLEKALYGHHGLLCEKENGGLMSETAFQNRYRSYLTFLETKLNKCSKRWYGNTKEHKAMIANGEKLPPWREVKIRCHDFRVEFCTRAYEADIPIKTLQAWMGHTEASLIMDVYAKLTKEKEQADAQKMANYMKNFYGETCQSLVPVTIAG